MANLKFGLLLIFITLTPFSSYGLYWGGSSIDWVKVEAEIVDVTRVKKSGSNAPVPEVHVSYQYYVMGKRYLGDRIIFDPKYQSGNKSFNISYESDFTIGQIITVFVDLDDPENVVIENGISVKTIIVLAVQFLLILFILLIHKRDFLNDNN